MVGLAAETCSARDRGGGTKQAAESAREASWGVSHKGLSFQVQPSPRAQVLGEALKTVYR